jgi:hypothetical protein
MCGRWGEDKSSGSCRFAVETLLCWLWQFNLLREDSGDGMGVRKILRKSLKVQKLEFWRKGKDAVGVMACHLEFTPKEVNIGNGK